MDSKIGSEMSLSVVDAIRGRCASFMILTATVWEISGGQTNSSILVLLIMIIILNYKSMSCHVMFVLLLNSCLDVNPAIMSINRQPLSSTVRVVTSVCRPLFRQQ